MMKRNLILFLAAVAILASCAPPAQEISGSYTGTYTNNALISLNGTAVVEKVADKTVNISLSATGLPTLTVTNIQIVTENNGEFTLIKTDLTGSVSGAVTDNASHLSLSIANITGAIAFDGTR